MHILHSIQNWFRHYALLLLFVTLQVVFWSRTSHIKPQMEIVPAVPGKEAVMALSFGDEEFYFRLLALDIQNAGDTYGRFTALRYYDFNRLYQWFKLLDTLDKRSNMIPAMATYYFSQTQNTTDIRYITSYLYEHATADVEHKWWWLLQSLYLAMHKLNDMNLAKKLATPLINPKVPAFAQQMAAVVSEKRGEMEDAYQIMETIRNNAEHITDADLKYMTYFIKERLGRLDQLEEERAHDQAPPKD
jgi:hypothetical protein